MHVLITGASGFIGQRIAQALLARGCRVTAAGRSPGADPRLGFIAADFSRDTQAAAWRPRVRGVDVVINTVGIFRETATQRFAQLHVAAPRALFEACAHEGVRGVVQLSALGADEYATTAYHLSKKAADDALAALPLRSAIVQPSLVFGPGGGSAELFKTLATLPFGLRLGSGPQPVQPIHIDDAAEALARLAMQWNEPARTMPTGGSRRIALVGPQAMPLQDYLAALRSALGLGRQRVGTLPRAAARALARLGDILPRLPINGDALSMLERGNTADPTATAELLGRPPRPVAEFIPAAQRDGERKLAQLNWLLPLLRLSVAAVWLATAWVSAFAYPAADSYRLLERTGVPPALGPLMLYGAAGLDLLFGLATVVLPQRLRGPLWLAQMALIAFYSAAIAWRLPEFLVHPYGPLTKNLPMLAAIWLLYQLEKRTR